MVVGDLGSGLILISVVVDGVLIEGSLIVWNVWCCYLVKPLRIVFLSLHRYYAF